MGHGCAISHAQRSAEVAALNPEGAPRAVAAAGEDHIYPQHFPLCVLVKGTFVVDIYTSAR